MTKNTFDYSKISEADDCLHNAMQYIKTDCTDGARERIDAARNLLHDVMDAQTADMTKEDLAKYVVETAIGINGPEGWDTVEDYFNVHFGIWHKADPQLEIDARKARAYEICTDIISKLLSAEKENFDQNFENVKKKLLDFSARTHKFAVGSKVSFSYNGKNFEGKISDVAWLPARGFVYQIAVEPSGWGEMTFDIPESNIKNKTNMTKDEFSGYYSEAELLNLLAEGKITRLDMVMHRSEEETKEFIAFCQKNELKQDEYAAALFLDHLTEETEKMDV